MHCLGEILDNAVDEALAGYCTGIEVTLHADGSAEVRDNGRGIPVDVEPKTGLSGVELVMTRLHAGGKFGGGSYTASGGLHGVGASVVNALSSRLDVEVDRDGHTHATSFRRGVPGDVRRRRARPPSSRRKSGLREVSRVARRATGTRIRFWPTGRSSSKTPRSRFDALTERARQTAFLVPGLTIGVRDEPPATASRPSGGGRSASTAASASSASTSARDEPVTDVLRLHRRRAPSPRPSRCSTTTAT